MDTVDRLLRDYKNEVKSVEKELRSLDQRADEFRDLAGKRDAIEQRIKECETQVSACVGTKEALFAEYQRAVFQEDQEQVQTIREQRRVLDEEVRELQAEIGKAEQELSSTEIDGKDVADFMARRDSLRLPSYTDLLEDMRGALEREKDELRVKVQSLSTGPLHGYDQEHYRTLREQLDPQYRSQQASERYYARKDAERREKLARLGTADTTDQMHANLGGQRSLSGNTITVTSNGSREHPFGVLDDE